MVIHGHTLLSGRSVDEQMENETADDVEMADMKSNVGASKRTYWSNHVRNSGTLASNGSRCFLRESGGGRECGMPEGRDECISEI